MELFVLWVDQQTPQGGWSSVLLECGAVSAMPLDIGVQRMQEWCAGNWASLKMVSSIVS